MFEMKSIHHSTGATTHILLLKTHNFSRDFRKINWKCCNTCDCQTGVMMLDQIQTAHTYSLIIKKVNVRYLYTTLLPAGISPISRGHRMTKLCRIMRDEKFLFLQETSLTCEGGGDGGEGGDGGGQ